MLLTPVTIADFIPLFLIVALIFLLKAGALAAVIVGIKKLIEKLRKHN